MQKSYGKNYKKNVQINAKIDEDILNHFRELIFKKSGLRKGDFSKFLQISMKEYVEKHGKKELSEILRLVNETNT